ncbi:MAG: 16S rRNA (adenine(1518)-N(6)/adenine(1519)-N(6))-dimethyltransferase RsmA [Gammaproteobacteria bacterium]|nr:16S rRNA (adenine(1518)-N(6)/adenine(1519)-N(6))-dimethyltransferase RsmA [Gammaproteobacteria bacterium]
MSHSGATGPGPTPFPKKSLGQHFLHERSIIERIMTTFAPRPEDHVIEIGPGRGALTAHLVDRVATLHLVELDASLVARLKNEFAHKTVHIHHASALTFDYCRFAVHSNKVRVLGNLPYNISTPILFRLLRYDYCISDMCLMLQKEVVQRIQAAPGRKAYGRLSVMIQSRCAVEPQFSVAPGAFVPPPKVDSAVLRLVPFDPPRFDIADPDRFADIVRLAFTSRRKTLRNALQSVLNPGSIRAAGVDPQHRAEQLSVGQFVALSRVA